MSPLMFFIALSAALTAASSVPCIAIDVPATAVGASIPLDSSFASFSFEPGFWWEFFGNATIPNELTLRLLQRIVDHGGQPHIRPGGITMDSMIFDPTAGDPVRTTDPNGGIYRTTVGPAYYHSWSNFPNGTRFISTINFGNNSYNIAQGLAVASVQYQSPKITAFELGNEPNNYPDSRWNDSTAAYVAQWQNWTSRIDKAVYQTLARTTISTQRWFASSATTDQTSLQLRPVDLIPAGIDSKDQVSYYSIHSYPFSTCDPARAMLATIDNILNHTELNRYAEEEIYPSAKAALAAGNKWIIGEFNSISCSGNPNVSDTFAQALWTLDSDLIYAARNASAVYLHQGATLVLQSNDQVNTPGANGTPGYSTYSMLYPRDSALRGPARVLPSFLSQLFMAEAFSNGNGTRVRALPAPAGVDADYFSAYALYVDDSVRKLAIINSKPYYANSTSDHSITLDTSSLGTKSWIKRLSAPHVDEKNSSHCTWSGQSFPQGNAVGKKRIEHSTGRVRLRGSEAILVLFDEQEALKQTLADAPR